MLTASSSHFCEVHKLLLTVVCGMGWLASNWDRVCADDLGGLGAIALILCFMTSQVSMAIMDKTARILNVSGDGGSKPARTARMLIERSGLVAVALRARCPAD